MTRSLLPLERDDSELPHAISIGNEHTVVIGEHSVARQNRGPATGDRHIDRAADSERAVGCLGRHPPTPDGKPAFSNFPCICAGAIDDNTDRPSRLGGRGNAPADTSDVVMINTRNHEDIAGGKKVDCLVDYDPRRGLAPRR